MSNKANRTGAMLQAAREEKNLSLADVEAATKIRQTFLRGLEEENYELLSSPVQVRGFLRNYSAFLGLDADEMIALYSANHSPVKEITFLKPLSMPGRPLHRYTPVLYVVGIALLFSVLIAALYFTGMQKNGGIITPTVGAIQITPTLDARVIAPPQVTPTQIPLSTPVIYATPTPVPTATQTPPPTVPIAPLVLTLKFSGNCWITVLQDNRQTVDALQFANTTKVFTATTSIQIHFGAADKVSAVFNGTDEGVLVKQGSNVVATFNWTKEGRKP